MAILCNAVFLFERILVTGMCKELRELLETSEIRALSPKSRLAVLGLHLLVEDRSCTPGLTEKEVRASRNVELGPKAWNSLRDALIHLGAIQVMEGVVSFIPTFFTHMEQSVPVHRSRKLYPSDTRRRKIGSTMDEIDSAYTPHILRNNSANTPQILRNDSANVQCGVFAESLTCIHAEEAIGQPPEACLPSLSINSKEAEALGQPPEAATLVMNKTADLLSPEQIAELRVAGWSADEIDFTVQIMAERSVRPKSPFHLSKIILAEVRCGKRPKSYQKSMLMSVDAVSQPRPYPRSETAPPDWKSKPAFSDIGDVLQQVRHKIRPQEATG